MNRSYKRNFNLNGDRVGGGGKLTEDKLITLEGNRFVIFEMFGEWLTIPYWDAFENHWNLGSVFDLEPPFPRL